MTMPTQFVLQIDPIPGAAQPVSLALVPGVPAACDFLQAVLTHDEAGVWGVQLTAPAATPPLREVTLRLCLPQPLWTDDLLFYDAGDFTNDFTAVRPFAEYAGGHLRDIGLLHSPAAGATFGVGYVTAHRFYARVALEAPDILLVTDMEDKPLTAGETYTLERFVICGEAAAETAKNGADAFLARYADTVAALNHTRPLAKIPVGWCSWSCFYKNLSEQKLLDAAQNTADCFAGRGASLLQIDDGWQQGRSFPGWYQPADVLFPNGLGRVAKAVQDAGMDFGLWLAPLIIDADSPYFDKLAGFVRTDVVTMQTAAGDVHPFNYDAPAFYQHLHDNFAALTKEYGVRYYKLDFIAHSFLRFTGEHSGTRVYSQSDYCVALLRKALWTIRQAVGEDVTLLSCGAPVLEGAGIFDAARTSADIIWGKKPELPTHWEIMQKATQTVLHRWFDHNKIFTNDPDGLVLREWDNGDGFNCTWAEAKFWATTVAVSGGSVLVNEELEKLSAPRRALVRRLAPPLGVPGRPCNFFQQPQADKVVVPYSEDICFAASYHYGDVMDNSGFATGLYGFDKALVVRCWDETVLGVTDYVAEENRLPHSAEMYLVRRVPEKPCFLYATDHVFCGVGLYEAALAADGSWQLRCTGDTELTGALYGWVPAGWPYDGPVEKQLPGGSVVCIRPAL